MLSTIFSFFMMLNIIEYMQAAALEEEDNLLAAAALNKIKWINK